MDGRPMPRSDHRRTALRICLTLPVCVSAGLLCLSLLTYDPADPPAANIWPANVTPKNWCGTWGASLADTAFYYLGLGAYPVAFLTLLGAIGLALLAAGRSKAAPEAAGALPPVKEEPVHGWLEMLDGNASRYPLRTTNVRIGRHRDNDICLQNDSISRRHAVLHFNANNHRFVITDLGGDNGVIVNKVKQQSHELKLDFSPRDGINVLRYAIKRLAQFPSHPISKDQVWREAIWRCLGGSAGEGPGPRARAGR